MLTKSELLRRLNSGSSITNEHWLFEKCLDSGGYGNMWDGEHVSKVHRISAYIFLELDLKNKTQHVLHKNTCPYKNCWNHNCLYIGTHQDNMNDLYSGFKSETKLRCGHPNTEENYYTKSSGKECRICHSERNRKWYARKKLRETISKRINQQNKVGNQS